MKLIVIGGAAGIIWAGQQSAVSQLQIGQKETTVAINELRLEMRERLVTKSEFDIMSARVESNARRIDTLEQKQMGIQRKVNEIAP